jgi:hypothetical protein
MKQVFLIAQNMVKADVYQSVGSFQSQILVTYLYFKIA